MEEFGLDQTILDGLTYGRLSEKQGWLTIFWGMPMCATGLFFL